MTQNYAKLKKYISQKGRYTEDGSQFINVKVNEESTLMIGYLKKEDKIDIGMLISVPSDGVLAGLDIIGNCVKSDTVSVKSALSSDGVFVLLTSSTKASAYKGPVYKRKKSDDRSAGYFQHYDESDNDSSKCLSEKEFKPDNE